MANVVSSSDFVGLIFIDTSKQATVTMLNEYIEWVENKYACTISDSSLEKEMYANFVYFYFVQDQETFNTSIGNVQLEKVGLSLVDKNKVIRAWNRAVEIYNEYTTNEQLNYITSFGI